MAHPQHRIAALALLLAGACALAAGPHQHGVASLQVVADGSSLSITLDSPLDNLLGFERGPRSEAERSAVRALAQRWHAGTGLARPTPAAGCVLQAVALASDVIDPGLLARGAAAGPAAKAPAAGGHADLEATLSFQCSQPQALRGVALDGLFQAFPRLRQLDAVVVAPGVQRGVKLGPQKPALAW
jgi:hypothetical protein